MKTNKVVEVVVQKKVKKVICKQKPKQYYFTLPHCKKGNIGGYCIMYAFSKNIKSVKSCRKKHLTVNNYKTKKK